ncbi:MAG: alpha/beta hydrolase [Eggerthia catenaformis]|uniref:alpha/beta hydrolase n=1 Tax=Eggerthia catenaformis TaxID=31973 RepID=UPI003FA1294B
MKTKTKVLIGTSIVSTLAAGYFVSGYIGLLYAARRRKHSSVILHPLTQNELDYIKNLEKETLSITSFDGIRLKGTLIKGNTNKVVICVHGYHSSGYRDFQYFIRFYHELGYTILLPEDRGHGDSQGKYIGFGWQDRLDLIEWIHELQKYFRFQPIQIALHGISMGASTVLMASGEDLSSDVKCIISDCAYSNIKEEFRYFLKEAKLPSRTILSSAIILSKNILGYDIRKADAIKQVEKSHIPTLFIHGDQDTVVPVRNASQLYNACNAEKELVIVKGAEHADSIITNPDLYFEKLKEFLDNHIN